MSDALSRSADMAGDLEQGAGRLSRMPKRGWSWGRLSYAGVGGMAVDYPLASYLRHAKDIIPGT